MGTCYLESRTCIKQEPAVVNVIANAFLSTAWEIQACRWARDCATLCHPVPLRCATLETRAHTGQNGLCHLCHPFSHPYMTTTPFPCRYLKQVAQVAHPVDNPTLPPQYWALLCHNVHFVRSGTGWHRVAQHGVSLTTRGQNAQKGHKPCFMSATCG